MKSVLLLVAANLRRRLTQSLLIGLTIFVSAVLFAASLGVLQGLNRPFETMFENLKASHINIRIDTRIYNKDKIMAWWAARGETSGLRLNPSGPFNVGEKVFFRGKETMQIPTFSEVGLDNPGQDRLLIVEGEKKDYPGFGEIWIPTSLASALGVRAGDTIGIPAYNGMRSWKVSAVVVDPIYSSGMINPKRVWVGPGALSTFMPASELCYYDLGIRLKSPELAPAVWKDFTAAMGGAFGGTKLDYIMIKTVYSVMYQMIGIFLFIFSILAILSSLFIIASTVSSAIRSDYRNIGILKAQGFTPGGLVGLYVLQFLLVGAAAIAAAAVCGYFAMEGILSILTRSLGLVNSGASFAGAGAATFLTFIILIGAVALLSARRAGMVRAVEAIRTGEAGEEAKKGAKRAGLSRFSFLPLPAALSMISILSRKRKSALALLTVSFTAFLFLFTLDFVSSLRGMADNLNFWGFAASDVELARGSRRTMVTHEALTSYLRSHPQVKDFVSTGFAVDFAIPASDENAESFINSEIYEGSMDALGLTNLQGRNPSGPDEIALGYTTARQNGKRVGDTIELFLYGARSAFTVVGIYQTVNNFGTGVRLDISAVRKRNPFYEPAGYQVILKDKAKKDEFIHEVRSRYGDAVSADVSGKMFISIVNGIISLMASALGFMALIFLVVSFTTVYNQSVIDIRENSRNFGVYKTVGFTPMGLRLSVLFKAVFIALCGGVLGLCISLVLNPLIWSATLTMFSGAGSGGIRFDALNTLTVLALVALLCGAAAWFPSRRVLSINPRNLILE